MSKKGGEPLEMWTCIEERDHSIQYGRNLRKIIFGNIFHDFQAAYSGQPIDNTEKRSLTVSICL